jgi:hypothetical protein
VNEVDRVEESDVWSDVWRAIDTEVDRLEDKSCDREIWRYLDTEVESE